MDVIPRAGATAVRRLEDDDALVVPKIVYDAGEDAARRFAQFFAASIRNPHTRAAYRHAVYRFMLWCEGRGLTLDTITPVAVAAYIERHPSAAPTVKQHLAAIRGVFDYLIAGGSPLRFNPAAAVKGPSHIVKRGKTPVLSKEETRRLIEAIDIETLGGLRNRALIGVMLYSFARVGATCALRRGDYFPLGGARWIRLLEKGGRFHELPLHRQAVAYLDAYLLRAGIDDGRAPLFQSLAGKHRLSGFPLSRWDAFDMVKRRAAKAGLSDKISVHSFRATGITAYLAAGGTLEKAQAIAAHESPRTTKLYDRNDDDISLGEIERISF